MQPLYCKYFLYVLIGFLHSSPVFYSHFILVIFPHTLCAICVLIVQEDILHITLQKPI